MFANVYRAERKERQFMDLTRRMAMLPENKVYELDTMLSAKRKIKKTTSGNSPISKILGGLGPSGMILNSRVNYCLSAIDRTIDNNILSLMGLVADATGISMLLAMQECLGEKFYYLARSLANAQNFGANALYQLQQAVFEGISNTILDVISVGTQAANEVINGITDAAFCALLPGLEKLQNELGGILGAISSIEGLIESLTDSVTSEINNVLYSLQSEINELSNVIAGGLFGYASNRGSTCASRPDSQLGIRDAIRSAVC